MRWTVPAMDNMDALEREAFDLHEALRAWLLAHYPRADALAVITACSYEIGRMVAVTTQGLTERETEAMLAGVLSVMREHIAAARRGLDR